jgi:hypothetical protein
MVLKHGFLPPEWSFTTPAFALWVIVSPGFQDCGIDPGFIVPFLGVISGSRGTVWVRGFPPIRQEKANGWGTESVSSTGQRMFIPRGRKMLIPRGL